MQLSPKHVQGPKTLHKYDNITPENIKTKVWENPREKESRSERTSALATCSKGETDPCAPIYLYLLSLFCPELARKSTGLRVTDTIQMQTLE